MLKPTLSRRRPLGARLVSALILALAATIVVVTTWPGPNPAVASGGTDQPPTLHPAPIAAEAHVADSTQPLMRERVSDTQPPATPAASFEDLIEQLVSVGVRTAEFAQQDEIDAARSSDQEARTLFSELMERFPDAGEHGLAMLAGLPDPTVDPRDHGRRIVLKLVLATACARRHTAANAAADRSRIDPLVQSLLDVMPQAPAIADTGAEVLVDRPYLRLVHEPGVLQLIRLAGAETFSRSIATQLLLTLWDNLQKAGERSSEELSRLAILLLADADPSQRTAACRQLLADPRYRSLVMSWLRERNDQTVASEVAGLAARELPPGDALQVLRELAPILPRAPGAYLVLAYRAPDVVADSYRELLASNTQPGVRSDLITGIAMTPSALGLELAQLALQNDPSPDVRLQAVFALTTKPQAELGERALQQILDDPAVAQDPIRLGAVVLALQNLEAGGNTNAIDRVGQRLRVLPLSESSRQTLASILARSLPGGQSSQPAPLPR